MLGERLLLAGGTQLVSALAVGCLVLALLLTLSIIGNVLQFRGSARLAADLGAKLAASEAAGRAEILSCKNINERVNSTVSVLARELHECRGDSQRLDESLARVTAAREAERQQQAEAARARDESIRRTYERDPDCAAWGAAPVCRARSDGMLGPAPERPSG